jgi:hypothetical protein
MHITSPPLHRRLCATLAAAGAAGLLAGCGLSNPNTASLGSPQATTATTTTLATSTAGPTQATTTQPDQPLARDAGARTQRAAIGQYAQLWCNWTTADLHAHERQLEAISTGGARAQEQLALAAATQPGGTTRVTTTCTVESLATGRGDAAGKWVLVTASHTSTPNMPTLQAQYHVTYVTLARRGSRYLVNSWLPKS